MKNFFSFIRDHPPYLNFVVSLIIFLAIQLNVSLNTDQVTWLIFTLAGGSSVVTHIQVTPTHKLKREAEL